MNIKNQFLVVFGSKIILQYIGFINLIYRNQSRYLEHKNIYFWKK